MSKVRINRYIASTGAISRRKADELLRDGRVGLNGRTALLGGTVDPDRDTITIDGREVRPQELVYLAAYKPRNVVTTLHDPEGRQCIKDLIPIQYDGVFPIGRLDFDAEGLLLLTNDGHLAHTLHHPSHNVPKTYIVSLLPKATPEQLDMMSEGVTLDGKKTRPAQIDLLRHRDNGSLIKITLRQGLKNQIKRMAKAVGLEVVSIKRVSVGPITVGGMAPGEVRKLSKPEIEKLHKTLK